MIINAIFVFAGIVVTALVTYFIARRTSSGRVDTSDAKTLWEEASRLRDAYRTETQELRNEVIALRKEVANLRTELDMLRATAATLRIEAEECRRLVEEAKRDES